ncbi:MAG: hypothetical protein QMD71_05550 [bacterium]|nr:hypothetical protein [bacterium]
MSILTENQKVTEFYLQHRYSENLDFFTEKPNIIKHVVAAFQKELIQLPKLIPLAKKKHIGLDEYLLSRAFFRVSEVSFLPRMVRPITVGELRDFFLKRARGIIEMS